MPPDRGRAPQACSACRKQKTRCYGTGPNRACLRCDRLDQYCSLAQTVQELSNTHEPAEAWSHDVSAPQGEDQLARFERLEQTIRALSQRVSVLEAGRSVPDNQDFRQDQSTRIGQARHDSSDRGTPHVDDQNPAPLFVLRDVAADSENHITVDNQGQAVNEIIPTQSQPDDIIFKRILSPAEAFSLLELFQTHYGRWVSFDKTTTTAVLLEDVRKYPLLLAACCLISVRHTSSEAASRLAPVLFKESEALLSAALLKTPQPIEFFQSTLILSMWSTTIAQVPLNFDSWILTGFALQHSIASTIFLSMRISNGSGLSIPGLDRLCIWNHMCLCHLHYCVGTRRKAIISQEDINQCRLILGSDHATNFETRMVAEVSLYWVLYESLCAPVDLPRTQAALKTWKNEWQYVLDRPRSQFVKMGFYFAQLLTYDQSLKTRSTAARESLLNEMVRLSIAIINLAMETTDERTRHLTDHIYHLISFAAITLSRLLHTYVSQLAQLHNLPDLEALLSTLVSWLHGIGSSSHIAHTMGNVVTAFHKKLRRSSDSSPATSYGAVHDDFAQLFPELFGEHPAYVGSISMLPDFQPIS